MSKKAQPPKVIIRDRVKLRAWVSYKLKLRNTTLAGVAGSMGLTRGTAYAAFRQPYPAMESAIAKAIDLDPWDIWPHRYDRNKLPIKRGKAA